MMTEHVSDSSTAGKWIYQSSFMDYYNEKRHYEQLNSSGLTSHPNISSTVSVSAFACALVTTQEMHITIVCNWGMKKS